MVSLVREPCCAGVDAFSLESSSAVYLLRIDVGVYDESSSDNVRKVIDSREWNENFNGD